MNFDLPEEITALRESVERFAQDEIAPHAQDWDRESRYPDAMIQRLGEQGLMGVVVPEEYGGAGGNYLMFAAILEVLGRYDGGLALAVEAHNGLCCQHLCLAGSDEQKKRFLPPLAAGEQIGSWCLTEPGSGTDAAALKTRAVREGDSWILSGTKQFITNGDRAGTYIVTAVTDPAMGKHGISAFIVERGTPGLSTGRPEEKLGMRSSDTVSVHLDQVRVPADHLVGEEGQGFITCMEVLKRGRVMISALCLGLARGALEDSAAYARTRTAFGKSIDRFQAIQIKLANIATELEAARWMLYRSVTLLDEGRLSLYDASTTKLFASEMATRACMEAIQIHGGYGYLRDYNVERYMRDAKLCEIGEGTSEILRVLIAKSVVDRIGSESRTLAESRS